MKDCAYEPCSAGVGQTRIQLKDKMAMARPSYSYQHIYDTVSRIPCGRVATYGQIAKIAGMPGQARLVGYALSALDAWSAVPWHRVVNARGEVSPRSNGSMLEVSQRIRLENEGITFDSAGRIPLPELQWLPEPAEQGRKKKAL